MNGKESLNKIKELNAIGLTAEKNLFDAVEKDLYKLSKYEKLEEIYERIGNSHIIYFKDFYGKILKMDTHDCFAVYSFNTRTIKICKGNYVIHSFQIDEYGKEWWEETELGESIEIVKNVDKVDPRDICPTNSSCDDCSWSGPCIRHPRNQRGFRMTRREKELKILESFDLKVGDKVKIRYGANNAIEVVKEIVENENHIILNCFSYIHPKGISNIDELISNDWEKVETIEDEPEEGTVDEMELTYEGALDILLSQVVLVENEVNIMCKDALKEAIERLRKYERDYNNEIVDNNDQDPDKEFITARKSTEPPITTAICPHCNGHHTKQLYGTAISVDNNDLCFHYKYKCLDCGEEFDKKIKSIVAN